MISEGQAIYPGITKDTKFTQFESDQDKNTLPGDLQNCKR